MMMISRELGKGLFVSAAAATLASGAAAGGVSDASAGPLFGGYQVNDEDECEADRSNHLLGGLLTDPLTLVADLLPFTLFGEQVPVCDEEDAS